MTLPDAQALNGLPPAAAAKPDAVSPPPPAGDHARLEMLYRDHARAILRYARRRIDDAAADDVVAETFLVAWRRRGDVPDDALPWLYAVASNVLRTQHRSARRQVALGDQIEAHAARDPSGEGADPGRGETADHSLLRALATLRPIDREAILLTAWEGLAAERAASAAGCSPATFHVRLHRAKTTKTVITFRTYEQLPETPGNNAHLLIDTTGKKVVDDPGLFMPTRRPMRAAARHRTK